MNIRFTLQHEKKSKKNNTFPVIATVYFDSQRVRKTLFKIRVLKADWREKEQRIKASKKIEVYNYAREFNFELDKIKSLISKYWSVCYMTSKKPSVDEIKGILNGNEPLSIKTDDFLLTDAYEMYIEQNKSHRAKRTIIGYTTTLNTLILFVEQNGSNFTLNEIDLHFFDKFRNYCFEEKKYLNNTFAKTINNLKSFMVWAEDRGMHTNSVFRKLKASEEAIEVIYLTKKELIHFLNYKFKSKKLDQVRDIYCFACFTGLRYSDLKNLKSSHIKDGFLKLNIEKTRGKDQVIPLSKYAIEILKKYKGNVSAPLPMISSQKLNEYIKEAAKKAEINEMITISRYSGRVKKEQTVPKHELLTIHTARKSFVTISLTLGMNQMTIRAISGHKSDSAFRRYVNVAENVKKSELIKHWEL